MKYKIKKEWVKDKWCWCAYRPIFFGLSYEYIRGTLAFTKEECESNLLAYLEEPEQVIVLDL